MSEYKKCTPKKDGYAETMCDALMKAIQYHPTKKSKGIFSGMITHIPTGTRKGNRITIHSGDFLDGGIVANFCPFCAGELRDHSNDKASQENQ